MKQQLPLCADTEASCIYHANVSKPQVGLANQYIPE